jgi:hypothetical protein
MTRFLLALLFLGLFSLALIGALTQAVSGKRPVLLGRPVPAIP